MTLIDFDSHVSIRDYRDLFPHLTTSWQQHFSRDEWLGSVGLSLEHVRVSDRFLHETPVQPERSDGARVLLAHQALSINGWADHVAARAFLAAVNDHAISDLATGDDGVVITVDPHDPGWSALEVRRLGRDPRVTAVAIPLVGTMLGAAHWDPLYEACVEIGLPVYVHFSGLEGRYSDAAPLSGGIHASALSRMTLMPHLAESNIASLTFEGALVRHPDLQVIFAGFGFTWLPSLMWRLDREWRTFRHDVPWVTSPPSERVLDNMWFTTWPVAEATDTDVWKGGFTERLRGRVVFGSHAPHDGDGTADVTRHLGAEWVERLRVNGAALTGQRDGVVVP